MKNLFYVFLIGLFISNTPPACAQGDMNYADLENLYVAILKMPSYKILVNGSHSYRQLFGDIEQKLKGADEREAFRQLSRLITALNDNHLGFYRTPDSTAKPGYISLSLNTDSLKKQLLQKDKNALEGVYYAGNREFGLYAYDDKTYHMVSLTNGVLMGEIMHTDYDGYDLLLYQGKPVPYQILKNVKLVNGQLIGTPFVKDNEKRFSSLVKDGGHYAYKVLDDQVGYLKLSNFNSDNVNIKESEEFYASIAGQLPPKHLIVDVRNNPGGGYKVSRKFINLLKKYKGIIFILQNAYTVSNAEQFIIALKGLKNVTTLGEQTRGMITFGSNYGKTLVLPSGRFTFYPTDMDGKMKELAYESRGISPDVALNAFKEDWIVQTMAFIKNGLTK